MQSSLWIPYSVFITEIGENAVTDNKMNKKIVGIAKIADEMHKNERKTKKMKE